MTGAGGRRLEWLTESEVSEQTKISIETLRDWRRTEGARVLPFHKIGRPIRYELGEVDAAITAERVAPSDEV